MRATIDLGLIPSIEYLRGDAYRIVPDLAIASSRPGRSVALFTTRPMRRRAFDRDGHQLADVGRAGARAVRAAVQDSTGDRVVTARIWTRCSQRGDAALIIGDKALLAGSGTTGQPAERRTGLYCQDRPGRGLDVDDRPSLRLGVLGGSCEAPSSADDVAALQAARDAGVGQAEAIARDYFREAPQHQRNRRAIPAR